MMPFARLYEVRDAIEAHIGAARAKELNIQIETMAHLDALSVSTDLAGFVIYCSAMENGTWRDQLPMQLDAMLAQVAQMSAGPEPRGTPESGSATAPVLCSPDPKE